MKRLNGWLIALVVFAAAIIAPTVMAAGPTGTGPGDPLLVTSALQSLAPNASAWYYFDYGADKSRVEVDVDANGAPNVGLAIYTPDQATAWLQDPTTKPVGIGSQPAASSAAAIHDLVWLGAFRTSGRYFAVVTNNNASPISYRLLVSGDSVTLAPTVTPTPDITLVNPFATTVPQGTIPGRVLFQDGSGGNIYWVNGDGTNLTRVTSGLDPALSPDGKRMAFTRWNQPAGVFIANANGTSEQEIISANQSLSPQWNPDGTRIVFTQQKGGSQNDRTLCFGANCFTLMADPYWKLGIVELGRVVDNVATYPLTEPSCSNHCFSPTWNHDGYTVAYADAEFGIMATDARVALVQRDSDGTIIKSQPMILFNQNPQVQSPRYSPDGTQIVFQVKHAGHWDLDVANADGSNVSALTHDDPLGFNTFNSVAPTWSPDGQQILFLSDRNGKWEFFVANVDGTNLHQVLKNVSDSIGIRYNFSNERVMAWAP